MSTAAATLAAWLEPQPPALRATLATLAAACLEVRDAIAQATLHGGHGEAGSTNSSGEAQKTLDLAADAVIARALAGCTAVAAWASEERDEPSVSPTHGDAGEYLVAFDPLDGSASAGANLAVGTIFSVVRHPFRGTPAGLAGFLQPGRRQCAAGYALYGPATQLVLTCGAGTAVFTWSEAEHEWRAQTTRLQVPAQAREFSINVSNQRHWDKPVQRYVAECVAGADGSRALDFNMRWIGCMVAEVHRVLGRGGIYLYPRDVREPTRPGRLRLLYEAAPMAFVTEQAGGLAVTGTQPILDVVPDTLHQTSPVILGSRAEVERVVAYHADREENLQWPLFKERSLFVSPR